MNQKEKAKRFAQLHVKGAPLLLYNAWDAGSAQSVLEAGAKAIATSVDAPVTVDFEAAIAKTTASLRTTFRALSTWA